MSTENLWHVAWDEKGYGVGNRRLPEEEARDLYRNLGKKRSRYHWVRLLDAQGQQVRMFGKFPDWVIEAEQERKLDQFFADIKNELPHGSGIDGDWHVESHTDTQVVFRNGYHTMDEFGGYDGWINFTVTYQYNATTEEVTRECPDCKGSGTAEYNFGNGPMTGQCTGCQGKRQWVLAPRSAKYVEINIDEDEWKVMGECGNCYGRHEWSCDNCRGTGTVRDEGQSWPCEECRGTGDIVCEECNEEGLVEYDELDSYREYLDQCFWEEIKL